MGKSKTKALKPDSDTQPDLDALKLDLDALKDPVQAALMKAAARRMKCSKQDPEQPAAEGLQCCCNDGRYEGGDSREGVRSVGLLDSGYDHKSRLLC